MCIKSLRKAIPVFSIKINRQRCTKVLIVVQLTYVKTNKKNKNNPPEKYENNQNAVKKKKKERNSIWTVHIYK